MICSGETEVPLPVPGLARIRSTAIPVVLRSVSSFVEAVATFEWLPPEFPVVLCREIALYFIDRCKYRSVLNNRLTDL